MIALPRLSTVMLAAITALVAVLLYSPLFVPIVSSFFITAHGDVDWASPTLSTYETLAGNQEILAALRATLLVGICTVILSVTGGTLLALYYHGRRAGRSALQFIIFLPFLMPPIISGLALLIFFREVGLERSLVTVVIGHTVFVLAIVYRTVLTRLQSMSPTLVEASYDLGATRWQTFWRVILPNLSSAMIGGAILAFALSFDETMITILVTCTRSTLPVRLWAMMRLGFSPDINALVALILLFTILLCVVAARFRDEDQAVALANDTRFGLGASIWSNDLGRVHRLVPRIQAGTVWVNTHNMLDPSMPFGGYKQSGVGREHGRAVIDNYIETKSVCIAYPGAV